MGDQSAQNSSKGREGKERPFFTGTISRRCMARGEGGGGGKSWEMMMMICVNEIYNNITKWYIHLCKLLCACIGKSWIAFGGGGGGHDPKTTSEKCHDEKYIHITVD